MTGISYDRPLTWNAARSRLRSVLEEYLVEHQCSRRDEPVGRNNNELHEKGQTSILSKVILYDLDLFVGALCLSVALLIISILSLLSREYGVNSFGLHAAASPTVYRGQVAASALLVAGSLFSLWMVHRRRFLSLNDSDSTKRREIGLFLRRMERQSLQEKQDKGQEFLYGSKSFRSDGSLKLAGTSLTDIYQVYRRTESSENCFGSWSRIPSLLLVQGDYIALQIGDIAPADCQEIVQDSPRKPILLKAGQLISLEALGPEGSRMINNLPSGRSTLSNDSDHLLTLCNGMKLFVVESAPIRELVRRSPGRCRSSQMARQMSEMRMSLSLLALILLPMTAFILFLRPGVVSGDLSLVLPLPLLAALGVFPVVAPPFVFYLEVLGTARILATVHPYASTSADGKQTFGFLPKVRLLFRYILATLLSRLSLWSVARGVADTIGRLFGASGWGLTTDLVRVPPFSLNLFETLGVATAFALIDDELACEPSAIPQQLLIPSGRGMKLLDLCPTYDDDYGDDESHSETVIGSSRKPRGRSFDSDSSEEATLNFNSTLRRKVLPPRYLKRRCSNNELESGDGSDDAEDSSFEVQFEDPTWWHHLPTLKCIGLACLVLDEKRRNSFQRQNDTSRQVRPGLSEIQNAKASLLQLACSERKCNHLRSLAQCIGFSNKENSFGPRGDLSPFTERLRLHILSNSLFQNRLEIDAHERSSEQSKWWGTIRPDSTSVVVHDARSKSYQLLTIGDPEVVINLCNEAWQGEISTILPLGPVERQTILDTTNSWKLADLDVAAFSYSPVPHTLESRLTWKDGINSQLPIRYLLDQNVDSVMPVSRDKNSSQEWSLIKNEVFLGVLGSLVVPRREIQKLLSILNDAGVRFVYFSPRNMRRQKELASQMGIDVAWNCAISLRPLQSGEEDPHRMVSNYGDWDVNAKLPHGVADVRKHLEEVDNVPLLVSLFTDVTKETTVEMVSIFQKYHDTVIAIGISHLPRNDPIFTTADIAVGIDVLIDAPAKDCELRQAELEFVSAIASHSCAFRFRGAASVSHLSEIIEESRAAREAAISASMFVLDGCLAFSLYVLFSVCSVSTALPFVPLIGVVLYLQVFLPGIGLAMAMTRADNNTMKQVPPKNDPSIIFGRKEKPILYAALFFKALPPSIFPQLIQLIAFGQLVLYFEPEFVQSSCGGASNWVSVIRCKALRDYSGVARTSAGTIGLAHLVLCVSFASSSFVNRFSLISDLAPWKQNSLWFFASIFTILSTVVYVGMAMAVERRGVALAFPWYFYFLASVTPFFCLLWSEMFKQLESKHERRAEKLRRLQFETRLGAWSPK